MRRARLGFLYLLLVPLGAGLASGRDLEVAGLNYTGWMWVFFLVAGTFLILTEWTFHRLDHCAFPYRAWLLLFGFHWLSLLWCDRLAVRNVQEAVQLSMPLLLGVLGAWFVRTPEQLRLLLVSFKLAWLPLCLAVVGTRLGWLDAVDMEESVRAVALTAVLIGCVCLAAWPERHLAPLAGWAACLLLTVLTGSRMATAALVLAPALHPLARSLWLRVGICLAAAGIGVALLYTPIFQERFFHQGSGTLADLFQGKLHGFGRFEAWPLIWERAWQRPYLGHGVGSAYSFVPTVWSDMNHAHNDYLRVGYETGLAGLSLLLGVLGWQLIQLNRRIKQTEGLVRQAFAASLLGLLMLLIAACTDNPLIYNLWFMNPWFALMGAAYGAAEGQA